MLYTNNKLKKILETAIEKKMKNEIKLELTGQQMNYLFNPRVQEVYDCIILSEDVLSIKKETYNELIEDYTDRTGYEASNNEMRINDFFYNEIDIYSATFIANLLIELWSNKLKKQFNDQVFCFIISIDDDKVTLRFHKYRESEGIWLNVDLEKYVEPVGYKII